MKLEWSSLPCGAAMLLAISCAPVEPPVSPPAPSPPISTPAPTASATAEPSFDRALLTALQPYAGWKKVSLDLAWGPTDCAAPVRDGDPALHASTSNDASTHGQKLYYLFARDRDGYMEHNGKLVAPGQVIVKESWSPIAAGEEELRHKQGTIHRNGKGYRKGERRELFVMMKLDPGTAGTDRGWVYGVASPDGERVLASGKIESCMGCHDQATGDRLLGPPY